MVSLDDRYGHYVGGNWLEPSETYTTISPATEEPLAEVGQATSEEVEAAVAAARDAFENGWSGISAAERAKYLFRIARILQERSREFAVLESLNGGKPIKESRDVDLPLAAAHFFYYAGWADKLEYAFPNRKPKALGVEWLTPDLYRLGASSLLNDVLMQLRKEKTGAYQSPDYFTVD